MKRDYFLGGNTNKGFFSYYNYLADANEFNKIYIIKGGPGTGKSTTMKAVAKWGEENNFDVDYIHCSSDPGSLDGVVIKEIGVAMVDGTAPHIVDARNVGAVETIINMGEFLDDSALRRCKKEIMDCNKQISEKFTEAYNFLEAAGNINKNCSVCLENTKLKNVVNDILNDMPVCSDKNNGNLRKLFADAVTPEGIISYADGLSTGKRIILKSEIYGASKELTAILADELIKKGFDVELFYSPLNPDGEIRHIIMPQENISIFTNDFISFINEKDSYVIDVDELVEDKKSGPDFLRNKLFVFTLLQQAIKSISAAKKLHDKLEGYYISTVEFAAMEQKRKEILSEIKSFAQ